MDAALETKFIECLSALESGESIEHILARYPDDAARLQSMLEIAAALPALRIEPSQAAQAQSRKAFLEQAATMRAPDRPSLPRLLSRPLAMFASLALVLIFTGGAAVVASASALPGDPLYGFKLGVESVRLSLAPDRAALAAQFEQERIDEIVALLDAGREADVEFRGVIESIQPAAWLIANLPVGVDDNTRIEGYAEVGRIAEVRGRTQAGRLLARVISVEGEPPAPAPAPSPTPSPTPTPQATETPSPTRTPGTTPSPTPTPSITPTPTPTPSPAPTEVRFTGIVERADVQTWTISGITVEITAATELRNNPGVGQRVEVRALNVGGGRLVALRIERIIDDGNGNDNDNGNVNGNDNGNGNGNDNGNGNGNDNDNGNVNGNANGNDNENDNSNDNGNGNSNDNENGNDNVNDNGNSNDNGNDNGNSNSNGNGN